MHKIGSFTVDVGNPRPGWVSVSVDGPKGHADFEVRDLGLQGKDLAQAVIRGLGEARENPDLFRRRALEAPLPAGEAQEAFMRETELFLGAAAELGAPPRKKSPKLAGPSEEDQVDLKRALMELGNRLVTEQRFDPSGPLPKEIRAALLADHSTEPITLFAEWLNLHPEAAEVLAEMGIEWRMPR